MPGANQFLHLGNGGRCVFRQGHFRQSKSLVQGLEDPTLIGRVSGPGKPNFFSEVLNPLMGARSFGRAHDTEVVSLEEPTRSEMSEILQVWRSSTQEVADGPLGIDRGGSCSHQGATPDDGTSGSHHGPAVGATSTSGQARGKEGVNAQSEADVPYGLGELRAQSVLNLAYGLPEVDRAPLQVLGIPGDGKNDEMFVQVRFAIFVEGVVEAEAEQASWPPFPCFVPDPNEDGTRLQMLHGGFTHGTEDLEPAPGIHPGGHHA